MAKQEEEVLRRNPWLDKEYKQGLPLFTREPGLEIDDLPERLGLLDEEQELSLENLTAVKFTDLVDTPSEYGNKGQFARTDGDGEITWEYAFWKPTGSSIYFKNRVAVGHSHPIVQFHVYKPTETCTMRIGAKTRPWMQWESVDGGYGFSFGIEADDKKFYMNYDLTMGTADKNMIVFDADNGLIGFLETAPAYVADVNGALRCDDLYLNDTNASHVLLIHWNEDDSANRTLNLLVQTGTRSLTLGGNLTIEANSIINQDLSSDSTVAAFATLTVSLDLIMSGAGAGKNIKYQGTHGGGGEGITYEDAGGSGRFGLIFPGSDVVALVNRASDGTIQLRANTSTAGSANEVTVVTIEDTDVILADDINLLIGHTAPGASMKGGFLMKTDTAPTGNQSDCFQMYSADQVAGNACAHFRTEGGALVKLYQQSLIADPSGQANDLDSEARTAINSILDLLENNGLMANA